VSSRGEFSWVVTDGGCTEGASHVKSSNRLESRNAYSFIAKVREKNARWTGNRARGDGSRGKGFLGMGREGFDLRLTSCRGILMKHGACLLGLERDVAVSTETCRRRLPCKSRMGMAVHTRGDKRAPEGQGRREEPWPRTSRCRFGRTRRMIRLMKENSLRHKARKAVKALPPERCSLIPT